MGWNNLTRVLIDDRQKSPGELTPTCIHEIAIDPASGSWAHFDMTAATGASPADGDPMGYLADVPRVVYRGQPHPRDRD